MRAIVYSQTGGPDVLRLVERSVPVTAVGQVRVRVHISGVNPTDWKSRRGSPTGELSELSDVTEAMPARQPVIFAPPDPAGAVLHPWVRWNA